MQEAAGRILRKWRPGENLFLKTTARASQAWTADKRAASVGSGGGEGPRELEAGGPPVGSQDVFVNTQREGWDTARHK